jgi:uncharacterized membrane protein
VARGAHPDGDSTGAPVVARWVPWLAFGLSLLGFGLSLYLTIEHFEGKIPPCSSSGTFNCLLVTTSTYSRLFGIFPVALLGLIFYAGMVVVNWPALWRVRARWVAWARLAMAVGGIGFVLYLVGVELLAIKAICPWCTGVHVTTFILFILIVTTLPGVLGRGSAQLAYADEYEGEYDAYDDTPDEGGYEGSEDELEVR